MRKSFSSSLIGYNKHEVDLYLEDLVNDYEEELRKKKDRIFELAEEMRKLKQQNDELRCKLAQFSDQEKYISRALIEAEQRAQAIIEEGKRKTQIEFENLQSEKEKWRNRFREVRQELLEFEKSIVRIIEKFHDDINFYAAKEIGETILSDQTSSKEDLLHHVSESKCSLIEEMVDIKDKKEKVIA